MILPITLGAVALALLLSALVLALIQRRRGALAAVAVGILVAAGAGATAIASEVRYQQCVDANKQSLARAPGWFAPGEGPTLRACSRSLFADESPVGSSSSTGTTHGLYGAP